MNSIIIVHGGAAIIAEDRICGKMCGIKQAVKTGYELLNSGGSAMDAVEAAIVSMEDDEYFNAGYGSVLNLQGEIEMDASIMNGENLNSGAVAMVRDVKNPIRLARLVAEKSPHALLAGDGASEFAGMAGVIIVSPESLVSDYSKTVLQIFKSSGGSEESRELAGTVGCVAMDINGNIAAGTSTGGTNGKLRGRIGDTPIIGSGTYADNNIGGVSCTGNGEAILRKCLAYSILKDMETSTNLNEIIKENLKTVKARLQGTAGAINISKSGEVGFGFTTVAMPWAYIKNEELHFGLKSGEDLCVAYNPK